MNIEINTESLRYFLTAADVIMPDAYLQTLDKLWAALEAAERDERRERRKPGARLPHLHHAILPAPPTSDAPRKRGRPPKPKSNAKSTTQDETQKELERLRKENAKLNAKPKPDEPLRADNEEIYRFQKA